MAINRWNNMARRLTGLNPLAYQFLAPMLVKEVQRLNARIKALEEK